MNWRMQSFHDRWDNMEDGAAGHVWKPRETAEQAVAKCRQWAGIGDGVCIPTMQVVHVRTGVVIWRSGSYDDKGAGPAITFRGRKAVEDLPGEQQSLNLP